MASEKEWKLLGLNLWQQVVLAMILGIALGYVGGEAVAPLKMLGTIFFKLIKMVIPPLILFSLIAGITSLTKTHHFKAIAIKGIGGYIATSLFAVGLGLLLAAVMQPGSGVKPPRGTKALDIEPPAIGDFLFDLIPSNIIYALANDMYLQIVVFAIFTGIVMNHIPDNTTQVKKLTSELSHIVFKMIEWIVRLVPFAVFGYMAAMVGSSGFQVIGVLLNFMLLVIGSCVLLYGMLGLCIFLFGKISPLPFYRKMINAQAMAFSTSSSKATLTTAMRELQERLGVSESTNSFLLPLGACMNMIGTAAYLGICALFFAQVYGVSLDASDYGVLLLTCFLGSIGAAGVPSGSIIFIGMVLSSVGIPMEGIAMILGVDRLLDMFRTTINVTGYAAMAVIVDSAEGGLNRKAYAA